VNPVVTKKRSENYVLPRALKAGDEVTVVSLGVNGFLLSDPDKNGNVQIKAGIIKTKANVKDLMLVEDVPTVTTSEGKTEKASKYASYAGVFRAASNEIDLRGMMGDEGWMHVDKYLDEASVSGLHTVHLIHGKGTGALRKALWDHLRNDDRVESYRLGGRGEGDSGVTVVDLR
jgi:DNA mismatch repair protein MutS2